MADDGGERGRATLAAIFEAAKDPELSAEELRLWLLYRAHEFQDGQGAFPGDSRLARMMDRSPRSVQGYRASLLESGYLLQELRGPRPARYRAVVPGGTPETAGDPPEEDAPDWPTVRNLEKNESGEFDYPPAFENIWAVYPRQKGKKAAYAKVRARVNEGVDPARLKRAARLYDREMEQEGREERFIKLPSTYFGPKDFWREQLQDGAGGESPVTDLDRQRAALDQLDGGDGE